jgi:acetyl-CoA carboxylase biotin carboxyl carrier protein
MSDQDDAAALLDAVCRRVPDVLRSAAAPPRRLRLQAGAISVELEWPEPAPVAGVGSGVAAGAGVGAGAGAGANGAGEPPPEVPLIEVRSPVVGVFYAAPGPGAAPFVSPGDLVERGDQVGIVEAMKTMIPVEAQVEGRVVAVLVADGSPVQYDQPLLTLEPVEVEVDARANGPDRQPG